MKGEKREQCGRWERTVRGGSGREQGSNKGQWKSGARKCRACSEKEQRKETTRGGGCNWLVAGATREEESEEVVKVKRAGGVCMESRIERREGEGWREAKEILARSRLCSGG